MLLCRLSRFQMPLRCYHYVFFLNIVIFIILLCRLSRFQMPLRYYHYIVIIVIIFLHWYLSLVTQPSFLVSDVFLFLLLSL
jgi:hypothetical protein